VRRVDVGAAVAVTALAAAALGTCGSDPAVAPAPTALQVRAAGCSAVDTLATGAVVGPGLVLTVAHALHGADEVSVDGRPADVVALDDRVDAALLTVASGTSGSTVPVALADRADSGAARVVTVDGTTSTRVARVVQAEVEAGGVSDAPTDSGFVPRRVLELPLQLESGDSGAPVVDRRARLIGMVFATSREGARSYAVAVDELAPFIAGAHADGPPVDLGACR
jgi:S1-C subfamily serine protease